MSQISWALRFKIWDEIGFAILDHNVIGYNNTQKFPNVGGGVLKSEGLNF